MTTHLTRTVAAWAVHAFTLTGIVWATLALLALIDGEPKLMWLYLGIALIVDGIDGTLARRANVSEYAPRFDGVILDSIIDYLTWTFIPALFMFQAGLLGEGAFGVALLIVINVTSMFCYANTQMKTGDYYFTGFPAAWNIVALALWLLNFGIVGNTIVVLVIAALTWAPITFVHPLRVKRFRVTNILAASVWIAASAALIIVYPNPVDWVFWVWSAAGIWFIVSGLVRTLMPRPAAPAEAHSA